MERNRGSDTRNNEYITSLINNLVQDSHRGGQINQRGETNDEFNPSGNPPDRSPPPF